MIYGTFNSIKGNTYSVQIECGLEYEIGTTDRINFADEPVVIELDVDDTFEHVIKTSARITLLVEDYIGDYIFTANDREIGVKIAKDGLCIFDGYLQPQSYNLDFAEKYTEITLNCQDYLCTLENHKYNEGTDYDTLKLEACNKSFLALLTSILGTSRSVYYDNSVGCDADNSKVFENSGISELMILGDEEDDLWTDEEILKEVLQYLNLHIIQIGSSFYIFNWANIKKALDNIAFTCLIGDGDSVSIPSGTIKVDSTYYTSDDTLISMADVYNLIVLECDLEELDKVFESPLDDDNLVSPYTNKNRYLLENEYGKDEMHEWYFLYLMNPDWTLRYYHDGTVSSVNDIVENLYDANGVAINQYKIPLEICKYKLAPLLCSFGKVNSESTNTDNTIRNNISLDNYLIITVNGSEDKDNIAVDEWNTISKALEDEGGMIEYKSTTTAGVISPVDSNTTNYIVFSGKIMLLPPLNGIKMIAGVYKPDVERKWYKAMYPNLEGEVDTTITKSLEPYYGYTDFQNKYKENYGEWLFYKSSSGTDEVYKVPLLVCELKIGDKYCVEVSENDFKWLTEEECTKNGYNTTFTLGINPAVGDYFLCKDWDISNTLKATSNVDTEGTAIPIKASDNLSGEIRFRILSPMYSGWELQIRRHPTTFRSTKWWTTSLPVMEFVQNIYIKDFECKLYSDNGLSNADNDKDLVYMTDVINNSIQTKDDITFKFNTALTTSECLDKGISTSAKLSNVMYLPSNSVLGNICNSITGLSCKAEEMYIKDYYDEYSTPKLMVETSLDNTKTSYWKHYTFNYFPDKEFFVIGTEVNLKYETTNYKLKLI